MSYEDWAGSKESPQFSFWQLVLQVELRFLIWHRAIHAGDFHLYIDSLTELQWLFHALNHHHYVRALQFTLGIWSPLPIDIQRYILSLAKATLQLTSLHAHFPRCPWMKVMSITMHVSRMLEELLG